ncbi:MAG: class I tRNA ligase family protein [Candidatus Heimdallarchaeota archaeon]
MYEFVSLRVNCPKCEKSLMDTKTLVDNMPAVKLIITFGDQKGIIHLSSIYGSYNYTANLKIPPSIEAKFSCPHCNENLISDIKCAECSATMIPLNIENQRGVVRICSRAGCKKHNVEFEDLSHALEHFHSTFDYGESGQLKKTDVIDAESDKEQLQDDKEIVKSGTFLRTYCPHCEESLYRNKAVELEIIGPDDKKGILRLSPYLNVFTDESTFYIPEGTIVRTCVCPHCKTSLIRKDEDCELCGSPTVSISVAALSKIIDFYFCSKKGCQWHGLSKEDIDDIIIDNSSEW